MFAADDATEPRDRLIVMAHPCSMREDGVNLRDRLLVAPVGPYQEVSFTQWPAAYYKVMPLPDLDGAGEHYAAFLQELDLAASAALNAADRVACLSPRGINFLMQRFVFQLTRVSVGTHRFNEACAPVLDEIEIVEEWRTAAAVAGLDADQAAADCHSWLRAPDGGVRRQDRLRDPQMSPKVRRDSDQALDDWLAARS